MKQASMTMRRTATAVMVFVLGLALVAGGAFAQGPGRGRGPGGGMGGFGEGGFGAGHGMFGPMMATALGLTDAQKEQIKSIFESTRTANESTREQMKAIHEQAQAAVKAGKSDAELQSLASSAAPLMTQLHASHLIAAKKAYQVLTPEQREKLESLRAQGRERMEQRRQRKQ
jgi:Spy/CpxP family protein refolding chaperone